MFLISKSFEDNGWSNVLIVNSVTLVGTTTVPDYCRAGGNGPNDFVCQGVSDAYITLVELPQVDDDDE
jgi:hypothetical protein